MVLACIFVGTTSAHAENTSVIVFTFCGSRNYLRARGEYYSRASQAGLMMELPPRTRRILSLMGVRRVMLGTTSAHAENTRSPSSSTPTSGNYLRARGEYADHAADFNFHPELPPRTRRIPVNCPRRFLPPGTTSAHAENTFGA